MTPSELKRRVEAAGACPHYFSRGTMRFFGDTMRNYGVRRAGQAWELYRKRPVKHGCQASAYFDCETFERVYPEDKP